MNAMNDELHLKCLWPFASDCILVGVRRVTLIEIYSTNWTICGPRGLCAILVGGKFHSIWLIGKCIALLRSCDFQ